MMVVTMLFQDRVKRGKLLYLKDGATRIVKPKIEEIKPLLHLRNKLANHIKEISFDNLPGIHHDYIPCSLLSTHTECLFLHL